MCFIIYLVITFKQSSFISFPCICEGNSDINAYLMTCKIIVYGNNGYDILFILRSHFRCGLIICCLIHVELMVYKLNWIMNVSTENVGGWALNGTYISIVKVLWTIYSIYRWSFIPITSFTWKDNIYVCEVCIVLKFGVRAFSSSLPKWYIMLIVGLALRLK
jgi:hypothetical protein